MASNSGSLTKTGYTFANWCTTQPSPGSSCGGTTRSAGSTFVISANITLYAVWSADSLAVTYDEQGGSSVADGTTMTGGSIASSPGTPTRAGFVFDGWFTASSGGSALSFPYVHGRNTNFTLYAQWTASSRTLTIDASSYTSSYNKYATAPTLTATASTGAGAKTYTSATTSVCTVGSSSGVVTLVTAGTCRITASIAADGSDGAATSAEINFSVTYNLGDTGPGGGIVFILPSTTGNTTGKYFESALGTWSSGVDANNRWCNNTNLTTGATGTAIGTGESNTNAIVGACSSGAAVDARAYNGGGLTDWFLPSRDELVEMRTRKALIGGFDSRNQCCPTSGVVNTQSYWSSSEYSSSQAIPKTFQGWGDEDNYGKIYGFNVRPVRSFSPITS